MVSIENKESGNVDFNRISKTYLLLLFILLLILISLASDSFILSENLYYEYFRDQLSYEQIIEVLEFKEKWWFLNYLITPTIYLIKFLILSMWIVTGMILIGYKVSFGKIFHACILAEFVLLIPSIVGLVWFGFIKNAYTLQDVQHFHPLSLLSLFNKEDVQSWMVYPLQSFNLFQIVYMFTLAFALKFAINKTYSESLTATVPIYLSGICIWLIFITFLTINYTV